ncbi:MAG: hypothetical protein ACRC9L_04295 [Brevinema sp.]
MTYLMAKSTNVLGGYKDVKCGKKNNANLRNGENDNLIDLDCVRQFAQKHDCGLTIMENGEHWFHTEQQLDIMRSWIEKEINKS